MKLTVCLLFGFATAYPVSQPVYPNSQYVSAQAIPAAQYRQQPQGYLRQQFISSAAPVNVPQPQYESDRGAGLQKYSTQIKQPQQYLIPADRQKAAPGIPVYLQQVQAEQAQQAFEANQRKAPPAPPVPQLQYREPLQQAVYRPGAQGYRQGPARQQEQENPEEYDHNPSYQFGFDVNDDQYTNYQNRKEQREGNKITGSYSVVDSDGFVRTVKYTADPKEGFKAEVTRQPTDIVVKIPKPDPQFIKQPQQQYIQAAPRYQKGQEEEQRPNLVYQYQ